MKQYKYFISIVPRAETEAYLTFFKTFGIRTLFYKQCNGTATDSILEQMGLIRNEKVMFSGFIKSEKVSEFKTEMCSKTSIRNHGSGLTLFIPSGAFGGESARQFFVGDEPISQEKENTKMSDVKAKLSLILTIVDKGYTETVMEAAKSAGATGGTVVKGKGTGTDIAKFFGVSISEEKEVVYIIANKELRNGIMQAVMLKAGKGTEAHGITFSLPVESVVGISALENL